MTGTDIREALRAVAEDTQAPTIDRLAFERQVRRERRHRVGERAVLGLAVAASVAVVAVVAVPFVDGPDRDGSPAVSGPGGTGSVDLQMPAYLVADGGLTAIDPQGRLHDLGLRAAEVIGYTSEFVYAIGADSRVVRFDATSSGEGAAGWGFDQVDSGVEGPVQSAQLSADGRWLGWVDLDERLHVSDLKAGTTAEPVQLRGSGYLVDLAQGTGAPLVADADGLTLRSAGGEITVPAPVGGGWQSTAGRDLVAVPDGETTRIYDVSTGRAELVDSVPGTGIFSPHGDHVVSVSDDPGDASSTARVYTVDGEPQRLDLGGRPFAAAWADDDTVLVSVSLDGATAVYGCDVADPAGACERLSVGDPQDVRLAR